MMISITVKLYAHLGDLLPVGSKQNKAEISWDESMSLNQLIDYFQIPRPMAHLVLVNGVFMDEAKRELSHHLRQGDVVAIWPPVAGG